MKRLLLGGSVFAALLAAVSLSQSRTETSSTATDSGALKIDSEGKNPWTNLKLNTEPEQFQFAVVSDRTGGHREKVFSRAVGLVNLLQPQFVMSVGDLIEGYTSKEDAIKEQWDQFDGFVRKFEMPFFYVPGNHDLATKTLAEKWGERYGRRYYHFTYKNVLFLCLCTEMNAPAKSGTIDPDQHEYIRKTLAANPSVRWTFVFLHQPIWNAKDQEKNGWAAVEKTLAGRKYTVFCGHEHRYQKYIRNGANYYQLATTGGGSRMRGLKYGEFDQIAWVTMKKDTPLIANVMLDGILPENMQIPDTDEPGVKRKTPPTHPVIGKATLDGQPLAGATVFFYKLSPDTKKYNRVSDCLTTENGAIKMSSFGKFDGSPVGEYTIAVTRNGRYIGENQTAPAIPERYTTPETSPLTIKVKEGQNEIMLNLTSK